jgi:hypothetical protein
MSVRAVYPSTHEEGVMSERDPLPVRGFLLHITHYDPRWYRAKGRERPFDLDLALEVVDTMADVGLNLLVIDCEDGVEYASHPDLARRYTVPMEQLETLARRARAHGIEVVPKINFARSSYHHHNDWFRPYDRLFDTGEYWQRAFQIVDELIAACRPERFFHIGMDEDHDRAYSQYVAAIETLHRGLAERGLRPVIWNDSAHQGPALIHAEKSLLAEKTIPRDVVQVPWEYSRPQPETIRRLTDAGFEVWGAPGRTPDLVAAWRDDLLRYGGKGLLLTFWRPCRPSNRAAMLRLLREVGPVCRGE